MLLSSTNSSFAFLYFAFGLAAHQLVGGRRGLFINGIYALLHRWDFEWRIAWMMQCWIVCIIYLNALTINKVYPQIQVAVQAILPWYHWCKVFHLLLYWFLTSVFGLQYVFLLADDRRCEIICKSIWTRVDVILHILVNDICGSLPGQLQITLAHRLSGCHRLRRWIGSGTLAIIWFRFGFDIDGFPLVHKVACMLYYLCCLLRDSTNFVSSWEISCAELVLIIRQTMSLKAMLTGL